MGNPKDICKAGDLTVSGYTYLIILFNVRIAFSVIVQS